MSDFGQDVEGAAEAYTALLQRAAAGQGPENPMTHAERMAAHVGRAAALLRLGRCTAAAADCDAALALLLLPGAGEPALPAGPDLACQAPGHAAAGCGAERSSARSASGCVKSALQAPESMLAARERAGSSRCAAAVGDATGARAWAHALAGLARGPVPSAYPCLEAVGDTGLAACTAPDGAAEGGSRADGGGCADAAAGQWAPGGGKRAMLLCALVRRGSAYAHAKRCAACGYGLRRAVSWLPQVHHVL
jgi:ribosomal protein L37E